MREVAVTVHYNSLFQLLYFVNVTITVVSSTFLLLNEHRDLLGHYSQLTFLDYISSITFLAFTD